MINEMSKKSKIITIVIIFSILLIAVVTAVYAVFFVKPSSENDNRKNNSISQASNKQDNTENSNTSSDKDEISAPSDKPSDSSYKETVNDKKEDTDVGKTDNSETARPEKVKKVYDFSCKSYDPEYVIGKFNDSQNGEELPYRMYLPQNYNSSKKYPVLVFLHSAGEVGTDNTGPGVIAKKMYKYNADIVSEAFVLCPQTNSGWNIGGSLTSVVNLLDELKGKYSLDKDRFYVTGISLGGSGTWSLLSNYSNIFAAGMPMCGWGDANAANVLKDIPIRVYHSMDDNVVSVANSQTMYDAITNVGGKKIEFFKLDGLGHDLTDYVFGNRDALCWLFAQNKSKNPTAEYEYIPYFRVVDSKGNTVISDEDIDYLYQSSGYEGEEYITTANIYLTHNGKNKLTKAYSSGSSKEFTVYWSNQKLYTYTATKKPIDEIFKIIGILDDEKDVSFQDTIQHSSDELKKINGF